jgi:hypothetical protein
MEKVTYRINQGTFLQIQNMTTCNLSKIQNQAGDTSTCTTVNIQVWALQVSFSWQPFSRVSS